MKVILLEDVYKHGVAGEVVRVADGFARNYLIPRGMAIKATPRSLKRLEELRATVAVRRAQRDVELERVAEALQDVTLFFAVKAGETGKLYGSVTPADIAQELQEQLGVGFDRRRIGDRPLRELGSHAVMVRLSSSLTPTVQVVLYREGEKPPALGAEATSEATSEAITEASTPYPEAEFITQPEAEVTEQPEEADPAQPENGDPAEGEE